MVNIVASYKYLRKSPCEAKHEIFDTTSTCLGDFLVFLQSLVFFGVIVNFLAVAGKICFRVGA